MWTKRSESEAGAEEETWTTVLKKDIKDSVYYFFWDVTENSAEQFVKRIMEANFDWQHKLLTLIINSYWGELHAAMSMIDAILWSKIPVDTIGLWAVWSSGLLVFMSGNKRTLTPNTSILSHQFSGFNFGKFHELLWSTVEHNNMHNRMMAIYKRFTGQSEKVIREKLLRETDVWITAQEAKKLWVCDVVKDLST